MTNDESVDVTHLVAVAVQRRGKFVFIRRSSGVAHDVGLWHCTSGYLEVVCSQWPRRSPSCMRKQVSRSLIYQTSKREERFDCAEQPGRNGASMFLAETAVRRLTFVGNARK